MINTFRYKEQSGSWKSIFLKIAGGRGYNYFSRGINEIVDESKQYPDLDIEKRLVLIYDRDYLFYSVPERKPENFFKFKAGEDFNRRNTSCILRIKI